MKRRTFVLGSVAAVGALVVGWSLMPVRQRLNGSLPLPVDAGQVALNGWVKVGSDNRVSVVISKSEMGQGVFTGLAMLLADEMDADWKQIVIEASPLDAIYNNLATVVDGLPFHPDDTSVVKRVAGWMAAKAMREIGVMVTGGSSSIKDLWLPMREAGAAARSMLQAAAAERWSVPVAECVVVDGQVSHSSGKKASFGELATLAARQKIPDPLVLKTADRFTLIGRPLPRIEALSKLDGSARFGIDVLPPGLLYASVTMCPTLGGKIAKFDGSKAAALAGVKKVVSFDANNGGTGGVAVIADTPYHAIKALALVEVEWEHGPGAAWSTTGIYQKLGAALDDETGGFAYYRLGDAQAALSAAPRTVSADYRAPYLAHATMEPMNCTAQVRDGRATVWAPTQVPGIARRAVAKVLQIDSERIDMQVTLLGGGFGRRLDVDFIAQAAQIAAQAEGAPVQTLWSREQDTRHDFYRPACVSRFKAGLDGEGAVVAWTNHSAGQAIIPQVLARAFGVPGMGPDKSTSEGSFDQPYEWPTARVAHTIVDLPIPIGFWRSVGHSHQAFFKESFVDEVAVAAGKDPVVFRAGLLEAHPRHLAVLRRAAELAGWSTPLAPAADGIKRARGIALHQSFGAVVAQVAEVSVTVDKRIRVHRVVCVIDCGLAVNPNLIIQQMESGIVFGLSAALYGDIDIEQGQVKQGNFHDYPVLRIDECPVIEVDIIKSTEPPEGVGEPGTPPIAPAVGNALFALTGQRLRSLPLKLS